MVNKKIEYNSCMMVFCFLFDNITQQLPAVSHAKAKILPKWYKQQTHFLNEKLINSNIFDMELLQTVLYVPKDAFR